jgi:pantoate--beta-alanine ligase
MRPGHFDGVLLILLKLLNLVRADAIYMGEKDYQQALLTQKLCKTFFISTEVKTVKTYRDSAGLPFSSRNTKLTPNGLEQARTVAKVFHKSKDKAEFIKTLKSSLKTEIDLDYYGELGKKVLMAHRIEDVRILDNKDKV